jgi:hypothetical protein
MTDRPHVSTVWQCVDDTCGKRRQHPAREREQTCTCGSSMFAMRFIYQDERALWHSPKAGEGR